MKLCPDCTHRPARDQRDAVQDGRCETCHDTARARPNAVVRKQRQVDDRIELAEAYV